MKITYVLTWAYAMGGTIRTVISQANAMARAGHDVELVSVLRTNDDPRFPVDPAVRMISLIDRRVDKADPNAGPGTVVPPAERIANVFTADVEAVVAEYFGGFHDRVLVTTRPALNLLSARFAPRTAVRVAQEHVNFGTHREELRKVLAECYTPLDALVTLTERDREAYREVFGDALRVECIPNALHTLDVRRADPDARTVVAAGRLARQKGYDMLIPAFAKVVEKHPDWRLRIYGGGQEEEKLRRRVLRDHLYNHVFLMGASSRLGEELPKGSIYALSSRFEGFPMVLMEALSHGLAPVAFDCPSGPREMLTDGVDGLLVPPADVDAFAAALCRVIEDGELRRSLGENALKTAQRYGPDSVLPRWERLFAELTGG
ncbi:glycosyltransferase family 4 protein [Actinomadura atramentaria]|uniref:glycosyltransferase family 4 protein n=1 Tax=Actinomadura atramentaria TaxID=1990 RepID=UPI000381DFDA|nr:glycosyltransferase family 4 protein [Actinomadura atramentaria]